MIGVSVFFVSCQVFFTGCAARPAAEPAAPVGIVYADTPPVIDGKMDDPVWKKALPLTTFHAVGRPGQRVDMGTAMLAWDEKNLYGIMAVKDKDVHYVHTSNTQPLWLADCVGVFVKPRDDRLAFMEVEINPYGAIMAVPWPSRGVGNKLRLPCDAMAAQITARTTVQGTVNDWHDVDEGWIIEFRIPWSCCREVFPNDPQPGEVWRVNVCGFDFSAYRERGLLFSLADGLGGTFDEYESYGRMVLLPPSR
jgi:hypothetical protein